MCGGEKKKGGGERSRGRSAKGKRERRKKETKEKWNVLECPGREKGERQEIK